MKLSIDRLIKLIPEWNGKLIKVNPINSGITNINFEVIVGGKSFFLSIPSSSSELLNIDYKNKTLGNKPLFAIEAGIVNGWEKYIPSENFLGMTSFGASGPYKKLYEYFGLTMNNFSNLIKNKIDSIKRALR